MLASIPWAQRAVYRFGAKCFSAKPCTEGIPSRREGSCASEIAADLDVFVLFNGLEQADTARARLTAPVRMVTPNTSRLANTARIDPEEFVASPACAGDAPTARSALSPAAAPSTLAACPSSRRRVEKPCRNVPGEYQLPRPSVRLVDSRGTASLGSRDFSTSVQIEDRVVASGRPGGVASSRAVRRGHLSQTSTWGRRRVARARLSVSWITADFRAV